MSKPKRLCRICHKRPPTVPDRETMSRPIKRICSECHAARLQEDMKRIAANHWKLSECPSRDLAAEKTT